MARQKQLAHQQEDEQQKTAEKIVEREQRSRDYRVGLEAANATLRKLLIGKDADQQFVNYLIDLFTGQLRPHVTINHRDNSSIWGFPTRKLRWKKTPKSKEFIAGLSSKTLVGKESDYESEFTIVTLACEQKHRPAVSSEFPVRDGDHREESNHVIALVVRHKGNSSNLTINEIVKARLVVVKMTSDNLCDHTFSVMNTPPEDPALLQALRNLAKPEELYRILLDQFGPPKTGKAPH